MSGNTRQTIRQKIRAPETLDWLFIEKGLAIFSNLSGSIFFLPCALALLPHPVHLRRHRALPPPHPSTVATLTQLDA